MRSFPALLDRRYSCFSPSSIVIRVPDKTSVSKQCFAVKKTLCTRDPASEERESEREREIQQIAKSSPVLCIAKRQVFGATELAIDIQIERHFMMSDPAAKWFGFLLPRRVAVAPRCVTVPSSGL